jgi:hypothetical protein
MTRTPELLKKMQRYSLDLKIAFARLRIREWYTATPESASIDAYGILECLEDGMDDMCGDWASDMLPILVCDDVVTAGIERMNELFKENPTYFEDRLVRF